MHCSEPINQPDTKRSSCLRSSNRTTADQSLWFRNMCIPVCGWFTVIMTFQSILLTSAPYHCHHSHICHTSPCTVFGLSYSVRIVLPHTSSTLISNSSPHSPPSPSSPSSCRQSPAIPSKDYTSYCDDPVCLSPGKRKTNTTKHY